VTVTVAWRLHGRAVITSLVLIGCAVVPLVVAGIELPRIAAEGGPRLWIEFAPQSYSPHYPDLVLQALWMLIAAFVGVPLAGRDIAQGTARFAWTQGASRGRWLLGTLLPVAGALTLAAVAFGLVFGWFFRVYTPAIGRWTAFELFAPALAGWTLAGLTLGLLAGVVLRRSSRALAAALAAYWALDSLVSRYLRPRYLPPAPGPAPHGPARAAALLVGRGPGGAWSYQPGGRFWTFQFIELALLLAVAAACTGLTYWLISGARVPGLTRRWPAWGRSGRELAVALGPFAAVALVLLITGLRMHAEARPRLPLPDRLDLLLLVPLLLGAFLGGPLVAREITRGTATFAWTQGMTRRRWAAGRLLRVGVPLALGALTVGLIASWWAAPFTADRLTSSLFDLYPPVYVGWTLVAFTLGALLGTVLREPASAIVLTLIGVYVLMIINGTARDYYLPPAHGTRFPRGADQVSGSFVQADGQPLTAAQNRGLNAATNQGPGMGPWMAQHHVVLLMGYQPLDRFWALQAIVAGGLLTLSGLLAAATIWLVRRRPA
jgi:ABC-type transport system involved in multi-copper enzyme maturation permease subunit